MTKWKTLSSEEVYKTPWIRVRRDKVLNHNGKPLTYSVVELNSPSVLIVAANEKGEVLLQLAYSYTLDRMRWQIPAGHSDGENLLKAAQRELLEETGCTSNEWADLGRLYQAVGTGVMPLNVFLAKQVYQTNDKREEDEQLIEQRFVSFDQIEKMAKKGEIIESAHLAALYLAKLHGL